MNMNRRIVMTDIGIAAALAVLVLIVSPGVAVAGMIAAFVLVVGGVSLVIDARRRRGSRAPRRVTRR